MTYRERAVGGARRSALAAVRPSQPATARILPDGCMDLIWDGTRLLVAGPDTRARLHATGPDVSCTALRFSRGVGPGLLGVAAHEARDQAPES